MSTLVSELKLVEITAALEYDFRASVPLVPIPLAIAASSWRELTLKGSYENLTNFFTAFKIPSLESANIQVLDMLQWVA